LKSRIRSEEREITTLLHEVILPVAAADKRLLDLAPRQRWRLRGGFPWHRGRRM
jgi:hypothetical protein